MTDETSTKPICLFCCCTLANNGRFVYFLLLVLLSRKYRFEWRNQTWCWDTYNKRKKNTLVNDTSTIEPSSTMSLLLSTTLCCRNRKRAIPKSRLSCQGNARIRVQVSTRVRLKWRIFARLMAQFCADNGTQGHADENEFVPELETSEFTEWPWNGAVLNIFQRSFEQNPILCTYCMNDTLQTQFLSGTWPWNSSTPLYFYRSIHGNSRVECILESGKKSGVRLKLQTWVEWILKKRVECMGN